MAGWQESFYLRASLRTVLRLQSASKPSSPPCTLFLRLEHYLRCAIVPYHGHGYALRDYLQLVAPRGC